MINSVFQMVASNAVICLCLALIALIVGRIFNRPSLTHLIWLAVLVKMLMPPMVNIPTFPAPKMMATDVPVAFENDVRKAQQDTGNAFLPVSPETVKNFPDDGSGAGIPWKQLLFLSWLLGSGIVLLWSLWQVYRFHRLLQKESESANPEICQMVAETASFLGLKKIPEIRSVSARVSPLVWWVGGKLRIIIPDVLLDRMEAQELRWILAHELAHVRRRDFLVRWVEWLTCVFFWWHPVEWWARRNLRINEELCCDELVLSCPNSQPIAYGESLLKTVEILSGSKHYKPILASGINSGELLKRRVRIILSNKWKTARLRWVQAFILLGGLIVLPMGLKSAQSSNQNMAQSQEEKATLPSSIPDGMRAVSVRVDSVIGTDYVLPGMRVDVIRTDSPLDGSQGGVSRIFLENLRVLAYDQKVEQNPNGQPQNISIVTLLVTPEQAQELETAAPGRVQLTAHFGGDGKAITPSRDQLFSPPKRTVLPSPRPDGMRAILVRVENVTGELGRFLVGARVDVIRTSISPEISKGVLSRVILEDVQVLAVGPAMEVNSEGQPRRVSIATLLVTPEQAKELVITESDHVMLVLRNPLDAGGSTESRSGPFNAQSGNRLPTVIPDGMRAIAVRVDNTAGEDNIKPGTRVDVIRRVIPPDGSQDDVSRIILENIQVLAFGQVEEQNSDGRRQKVTVATLLVTPEQGQRLALGGSDGFQLAVRK